MDGKSKSYGCKIVSHWMAKELSWKLCVLKHYWTEAFMNICGRLGLGFIYISIHKYSNAPQNFIVHTSDSNVRHPNAPCIPVRSTCLRLTTVNNLSTLSVPTCASPVGFRFQLAKYQRDVHPEKKHGGVKESANRVNKQRPQSCPPFNITKESKQHDFAASLGNVRHMPWVHHLF